MDTQPPDLHLIPGINTGKVTFQFEGHYRGKAVTWQCTLQTLDHYYQQQVNSRKIDRNDIVKLKRFIDVADTDTPTPSINIVLDVQKIDEPTIRKAIIMVHNYKKLHAGRHEYGEAHTYPRK